MAGTSNSFHGREPNLLYIASRPATVPGTAADNGP